MWQNEKLITKTFHICSKSTNTCRGRYVRTNWTTEMYHTGAAALLFCWNSAEIYQHEKSGVSRKVLSDLRNSFFGSNLFDGQDLPLNIMFCIVPSVIRLVADFSRALEGQALWKSDYFSSFFMSFPTSDEKYFLAKCRKKIKIFLEGCQRCQVSLRTIFMGLSGCARVKY